MGPDTNGCKCVEHSVRRVAQAARANVQFSPDNGWQTMRQASLVFRCVTPSLSHEQAILT